MTAGLFFLAVIILDCPFAFADNCGSLYDCFGTMQSATGVGVGIAVMMAVGWLINLFSNTPTTDSKKDNFTGTCPESSVPTSASSATPFGEDSTQ